MNGPFQVAQANIATQTSGKPPARIVKVTKPFGEQSVVVPLSYDGTVKADLSSIAGENITLVHIGEKLIILFDNKSTVTLEPFFDANGAPLNGITVEVSPGRDLTGTEFAALFPVTEDRSILPAAGDGNGSGAQASGANFTSVGVDPLAAPNPIDLLGQEDLPSFTINTLLRQNDFINGIPSALRNGVVALDEDEIPGAGGNAGGPGDIDAPHTFSGRLGHDFGLDGAGSVSLAGMNNVVQVINGITVTFTWNEATHTLTANDGSADVFKIVITNPADGDYTVTLLNPLHHHTDALADNTEAGDTFNITYTVTDSNNTTATGTLTLQINDDTPEAHDTTPEDTKVVVGGGEGEEGGNGETITHYATIDDEGQTGGNAGGDLDGNANGDTPGETTSVSGKLDIAPGADGLKAVAFTGSDGQPHVAVVGTDGAPPQVIFVDANGIGTPETVKLVWQADANGGGKLIGITDNHFTVEHPAFTLTVDAQGNYTLDVSAPFVHPVTTDGSEGSIGFEDNIQIQFTYTATDGDGDKSSATLTFNIDDDTPTVDVTADGRGNDGQQEHALLVSLDESIGGDRGANGAPDGDNDDVENPPSSGTHNTLPDPTGHDAIGKVSTAVGDGEGESRGGLESLFNVAIHAGADGLSSGDKAITYSYALSLTGGEGQGAGVATTLKITDPNHTYADDTIYLVKVSDTEIVGYVGNHVNGAGEHDGAIAIRITLTDANDLSGGQLVVEQYMPIDHGVDRNENDPSGDLNDFDSTQLLQLSGGASLGVTLTTTVTDGDGDKATDSATVVLANNDTSSIGFQDDGPAPLEISVANGAANGLFFGGFTPNNDQWGAGSGINTTGEAGGWHIGPATVNGATNVQLERVGDGYRGADSPTDSVMVDMEATPGNLKLTQDIAGLSAGTHHLTFEIGAASDAAAGSAVLKVYWNGELIGTYEPHSGVMQTISVNVTAIAGNNQLTFEEVGTSGDNTGTFLANVKLGGLVIIDETKGIDPGSDDVDASQVSALFASVQGLKGSDPDMGGHPQYAHGKDPVIVLGTPDFGTDGPAAANSVKIELGVSAPNGVDSGLMTTDGKEIYLFAENGLVVGRYDADGDHTPDTAAFALHIGADGTLSIVQYVSLQHPDNGSNDEGIYLKPGTVQAIVTVTDGDGDHATSSTDISGTVRFEDDGPSVGSNKTVALEDDDLRHGNEGGPGDDSAPHNTQGTLSHQYGADGAGSTKLAGVDLPSNMGFESHVSDDGKTIIIEQNGHDVLKIELTDTTSGEYKVTQLGAIDHPSLDGKPGDNTENNLEFTVKYTVTDGDGDSVTGSLTINVDDDTPEPNFVLKSGALVTIDETPGLQNDDTNNAFPVTVSNPGHPGTGSNFETTVAQSHGSIVTGNANYGADGLGSTVFSIDIPGGNSASSGLYTTDGHAIKLFEEGNIIVGRYDTHDGNVTSGDPAAFAIYINPTTGEMSVVQYVAIKHDDRGDFDESDDNGKGSGDANPSEHHDPVQQSIIDGAVRVTVTVTDHDGDSAQQQFNVGSQIVFEDDGPSVGSNKTVVLEDDDLRNGNEGGPGDDSAPQNAQGTLSHEYGADGAGSTKLTGVDLPSHMGFESHVSSDGKTIIIEQNGHDVLKIELTDSTSGEYKVTQLAAIDHPSLDGKTGDNTENNVEFTVKYTVTDGDGDSIGGSLTINVDDDTPEPNFVLKSGALVTIDETPGLQNDDTNNAFPKNVSNPGHPGAGSDFETTVAQSHGSIVTGSANYGADGPGKTVFSIDIPGGDSAASGLTTTDGHAIKLFEEGDIIVGRYDTHDGNVTSSDPAAFAIYINPTTGEMSVVQYVAIKHDDRGDFDESNDNGKGSGDANPSEHNDPVQQSIIDGAVRVTVTVTDHDGDTAQQQFNVGSQIVFEDDGPSVGSNKTVALEDEDVRGVNGNEGGPGDDSAPQNAQGTLSHEYGADGAGSTKLTGVDLPSNMGFESHVSSDGKTIIIEQNGHDVLKIELTDTTSGEYKVTQLAAIDHPSLDGKTGDNTENNVEFTVKYTVTDGDGDSITGNLTINVDDDTPEPNFVLKSGALVTIDETPGLQNDDTNSAFPKNVSNPGHPGAGSDFETTVAQSHGSIVTGNANYGADGPGKTVFSIDIPGGDSASSGLTTTDGHAIKLFEEGDIIVGRYDTHDGNVTSGDPAAFAIYINPTTGEMSVVQYVAIKHDDRGDFDESDDNGKGSGDANPSEHHDPVQQSIIDGAVRVTVTVTDHDGDSAQQQFNVGSQIVFQDDGPSITITASDNNSVQLTTHDADTIGQASSVSTADFSGVFTTTKSFGADGAGSTSFGYKLAITAHADQSGHVDSHLDSQGKSIYLYSDSDGNIIGSTASDKYHINSDNTIFKLTVDDNGVVKLTQYAEIDHPISNDPHPTDSPFGDDRAVLGDNLISLTRSGSITDGDGDTATDSAKIDLGGNIRFEDDGPRVTALADKVSIDEANLPSDRNPTADSPVGIAQAGGGSLHINWGADNSEGKYLTFAKDDHGNVIGPDLTSGGIKLVYQIEFPSDSPGNEQIVAYKDGDPTHPVFAITLYESGSGSYAYVQFQNIDHSGSGADTSEFNFNIVAHDADGDTVQQTLTIDVKDDVPTAGNTSLAVDEDDLSTGNADVQDGDNLANPSAVVINNHLSFTAGADGLKSLTFETMTGAVHTTGGAAVTMGHVALTYVWIGNTLWATTDAAHPSDANSAFKVTITDASTGAYTFTLLHAVDHPLTDDSAAAPDKTSFEDNLDISLTFTVTDGDNDSKSTGTLSINLDDDSPVIGTPDAGSTSEANIATTTATAHGSLGIHFGADGAGAPGAPASHGTPHTIDFNGLPQGGLTHFTQDGFTFQTNEGIANTTGHTGQLQGSVISITNGGVPFTLTSLDLGFDGTSNGAQYDNITLIGTDTHGHQITWTVHLGVVTPANAVGTGTPLATTFNAAGTDLAGVELTSLQILAPHNNDANGRAIVDNVVVNTGSAPLTHGAVSFTDLDTAVHNVTIENSNHQQVNPATLTSHGETIHYALLDSMTLVGYTGDTVPTAIDGTNVVFSVVLSQDATHPNGTYDFTLRGPLDDLPSGEVSDLNFTFGFTAKDGDGDAVNGHFTVDVKDDVPHATAEAQTVAEGASITGKFAFDGGADGATVTHIGNEKLVFDPTDHGYSQSIDLDGGSIKVKADGSYVFTADDAVNNTNGPVDVHTTFTVTDGDGDPSTANVDIKVTDANKPTGGESTATVDDDGLSGGNPANAAGDIDANVGDASNDHNEAVFTGTLAGTMGKDGAGAFSFIDGHGNLGGEKLEFTWSGNTLTATVTESPDGDRIGTTLFTVVVTDPVTGAYKVTLNENVLHTSADNAENSNASIKLPYTVTDGDGSEADGNLTITFNDDSPTAVADVNTVQSGDTVHGNVITDAAGHDAVGADGLGSIVWSGASSGGILTGDHGILKVGSDGSYTYEAFANSPGQDSFSYTITDRDGDTSHTTLTITVSDGRPLIVAATAEVDEAALDTTKDDRPGNAPDDIQASTHTGSNPGSDAETVSGSLTLDDADTPHVTSIKGSGPAQNVGAGAITVDGAYGVLKIDADGHYTYTLTSNDPHHSSQGTGTDQQKDVFTYTVTDSHGNTSTSTITIDIKDDVPHANAGDPVSIAETAGAMNGTLDFVAGADGAAVTHVKLPGTNSQFEDITTWASDGHGGYTKDVSGVGAYTFHADGSWTFDPEINSSTGNIDGSFSYRVTDGDGDISEATQTVTVTNANSLPTAGETTASVDDDGLAHGNPGDATNGDVTLDSPENVAHGTLPHDYKADGPAASDPVGFAPMDGEHGTVGTESVTYHWDAGSHTLTATSEDRGDIFKVVVDEATGKYDLTLLKPVMHEAGGGENDATVELTYQVKDSSNDTAEGKLTVTFNDDTPVAHDQAASVTEGSAPTLNAILVIDLSASMDDNSGVQGLSRLELMQQAVANYLNSPGVHFNEIVIYTFNDGAHYEGTFTNVQDAINKVNSYDSNDLVAATEYDTTAEDVREHFEANVDLTPADQTHLLFLSDGDPTGGSALNTTTEQNNWRDFLNDAGVDKVIAVGFGGIDDTSFLSPMAPRSGDEAIAVENPNQLAATLQGSLPSEVSGNVLDGHDGIAGNLDDVSFGADGGHIQSIKVGDVTYTYHPDTGSITASDGHNPTQHTPELTVTTSLGGTLEFNFNTGAWEYSAPPNGVSHTTDEKFDYVVVDNDGDKANATLTVTVVDVPNQPPVLHLNEPGTSGNVSDNFSSSGYGGGSGWNGSWVESNDGGGSNGGVSSGSIRISSGQLRLGDNSNSENGDAYIERAVNLSGTSSSVLTFTYTKATSSNSDEGLTVQAWNGTEWRDLTTAAVSGTDANGSTGTRTAELTAQDTKIRFVMNDELDSGEYYYIDNVNIAYTTVTPSVDHVANFTEHDAAISIAAAGPTISDTDDTVMESAKIVLTNAKAGDVLAVGGLPTGIHYDIDTSVAGQITVNLSGNASLSSYQAAIKAVTYQNTSDNPGSDDRTIHVTVTDDHGNPSNVATTTVHVTPVNDAPTTNDVSVTATEGASSIAITLTGGDVDGTVSSFKISGLPSGATLYSDSAFQHAIGNGDTVSASGNSATVYFKPASDDASGQTTFKYAAVDNNGTADGTPATATVNITPVNDAPSGTDNEIVLSPGGIKTFSATDFGFSDSHDSPANAFKSVIITSLPGEGTLKLNGLSVSVGQEISIDKLGGLKFTAAVDEVGGDNYASFTFQVRDDGGVANGGVDTDQSPNTITFDVNTAPVIWAPEAFNFAPASTSKADMFTSLNMLKFADASSTGAMTVTLKTDDKDARFLATGTTDVTVSGNDTTSMTLTGTLAAINAFIADNHLTYDLNNDSSDKITVTITDNHGAGDTATITVNDNYIGGGTGQNLPSADTFNIHQTLIDLGSGTDNITTGWNHLATDPTTYRGGSGSDTIRVVFTGDQLNEILNDATERDNLRSFLGNPSGHDLDLSNSSWHAKADQFETANLGLAAPDPTGGDNNYLDLATWKTLPAAVGSGTAGADLMVGTAAGQTLEGLGGNDVLAAYHGGSNTLNGGAGSDLLLGGDGNDILNGGQGNDILSGGKGADTFKAELGAQGTAHQDTIVDYNFSEGDKLDLSALLDAAFDPGDNINSFVKVSVSGDDLLVRVNTSGNGNFTDAQNTFLLAGAHTSGGGDPIKIYFDGHDHVVTG